MREQSSISAASCRRPDVVNRCYQAGFSSVLLDLKLLALCLRCFALLSDIVQLCLQVLVCPISCAGFYY